MKGYAFIEYENKQEADAAIKAPVVSCVLSGVKARSLWFLVPLKYIEYGVYGVLL